MSLSSLRAEELVALLDRESRDGAVQYALASDGDGTIWEGDVGDALFLAAIDGGLLRAAALEALQSEAREFDVAADGDANMIGRALFAAHRAGRYPNQRAFAMMTWAFAGFSLAEVDALSEKVLDDFGFGCRPEMAPVLDWCQRRGVDMWLVSASPLTIAEAAARRLSIAHTVAMVPATEDGVIVPRLNGEPTYRDGKLTRLRQELPANTTLLAAFGDSYWDGALLEEARLPVGVFPTDDLRAHLAAMDRGYVLEK
jgi:phosphatidylglycerophosphatase C